MATTMHPSTSTNGGAFGAHVEEITPELARRWLKRNEVNRRCDEKVVARYARDMKAGNWLLTGDPIAFDGNGDLRQGQHRLHACIRAGVSFTSLVVRGVAPEAQLAMDSGKKRSMSDQLRLLGEKNTADLAATASFCWKYDRELLPSTFNTPTTAEVIAWIEENPAVRDALAVGGAVSKRLPVGRVAVNSVYFLTSRADDEDAREFFKRLTAGAGLDEGDPILAVRRWLDRWAGKRDKPVSATYAHALLKSCNYWRSGRSIAFLKVLPREAFPRVWGER